MDSLTVLRRSMTINYTFLGLIKLAKIKLNQQHRPICPQNRFRYTSVRIGNRTPKRTDAVYVTNNIIQR